MNMRGLRLAGTDGAPILAVAVTLILRHNLMPSWLSSSARFRPGYLQAVPLLTIDERSSGG
jgi:hypothetical protein